MNFFYHPVKTDLYSVLFLYVTTKYTKSDLFPSLDDSKVVAW